MGKLFLFYMLIASCGITLLYGQSGNKALLSEIRKDYEQLDYQEAELKAMTVLQDYEAYSREELATVHQILALIYYSQNRPAKSREQFHLALSLMPDLSLDPVLVSPKILEFFDSVKKSRYPVNNTIRPPEQEVRYIMLTDPRPSAALRSMILPGWGQMYKKQKTKGVAFTALWGAALGGTVFTHLIRKQAENDYLNETAGSQIEGRYRTFNRYHKLRTGFAFLSAAVWLISYLDAFFYLPPANSEPGTGLELNYSTKELPVSISLSFRF